MGAVVDITMAENKNVHIGFKIDDSVIKSSFLVEIKI